MEGVTDAPMRALFGGVGAFTYAVSEFHRVSQTVATRSVLERHVPELTNHCRTPTGLPVQVQLLGGHAGRMAASAAVAVAAGAAAIDINFGCPAPTVNRHDGGATLLKHPERIREIVQAVREAVAVAVPVSAKLRLGWDDGAAILQNAAMAEAGGAAWLTIHARTRMQGYAPPVDWPRIGEVRRRAGIPVIANGDIWTMADFERCREETGCRHFMLGRGVLANPALARHVAMALGLVPEETVPPNDWPALLRELQAWSEHYGRSTPRRTLARMKQWLRYASTYGDFPCFDAIKQTREMEELFEIL